MEELYAKYLENPAANTSRIPPPWTPTGGILHMGRTEKPHQPSWARADWPLKPSDELTAALDGNWTDEIEKALAAKISAKESPPPPQLSQPLPRLPPRFRQIR